MKELVIQIVGGVIVIIIAAIFGIGGTTKVSISGGGIKRRTGKKIIIISVLMILGGLAWAGRTPPVPNESFITRPGSILAIYGVIFFIVGKAVAWYQR